MARNIANDTTRSSQIVERGSLYLIHSRFEALWNKFEL